MDFNRPQSSRQRDGENEYIDTLRKNLISPVLIVTNPSAHGVGISPEGENIHTILIGAY
jgi:hypothetical protein